MSPLFTAPAAPAAAGRAGASRTTRPPAECHIWSMPPLPQPSAWFGLLDSTELVRCSSMASRPSTAGGPDLAGFVTGRVLARTALSALTGISPEQVLLRTACPDCGGPHGKPQIVGAAEGWELSVSHAGGLVAVALALDSPVGIGVRRARPRGGPGRPPEHELLLTPVERAVMERLPRACRVRAALTYRTRKEAVLKAIGESRRTPLTDFAVSRPDRPPALLGWYPPDGGRPVPAIADVRLAGRHHAAVAASGVRSVLPTVHDGRDLLPGGRPARWWRKPAGRPGFPSGLTR